MADTDWFDDYLDGLVEEYIYTHIPQGPYPHDRKALRERFRLELMAQKEREQQVIFEQRLAQARQQEIDEFDAEDGYRSLSITLGDLAISFESTPSNPDEPSGTVTAVVSATDTTVFVENGEPNYTYIWRSVETGEVIETFGPTSDEQHTIYERPAGELVTCTIIDGLGQIGTGEYEVGTGVGFRFMADYMLIEYEFSGARDLDTRTWMPEPEGYMSKYWIHRKFLGWYGSSSSPGGILTWGGDNEGTGFESVLVDVGKFKTDYRTKDYPEIVIDCRAVWYYASWSNNPVNIKCTLWQGGVPSKLGYTWKNYSATDTFVLDSQGVVVTAGAGHRGTERTPGQRVCVVRYDHVKGIGSMKLDEDDDVTQHLL